MEEKRPRALMMASVASMIDLFNTENVAILRELGCDVDVAANFEEGSITSQERVDAYRRELDAAGIGVTHLPVPRSLTRVGDILRSYRLLRRLAEEKDYDLVHCHSPIGGVICRMAFRKARKRGTKMLYTAHGFHFFRGAPKKAWLLYYPAEKLCSRFTDVLITINREDTEAAKRLHAGRVVYVPGVGIRTADFADAGKNRAALRASLGFAEDDFVFMSAGQLSVRKNHETVLRALAKLGNPRIKYVIAGFGELEAQLRELARSLGLADRVVFVGYREDVRELLCASDAFVFPSKQEGLSVALMEAMAAGLPVVCSRIRGNTDLIEDGRGGLLCDPDDADGFAEAMKRVVAGGREEMRRINLERIRGFDVSVVREKMRALYERVLAQGNTNG